MSALSNLFVLVALVAHLFLVAGTRRGLDLVIVFGVVFERHLHRERLVLHVHGGRLEEKRQVERAVGSFLFDDKFPAAVGNVGGGPFLAPTGKLNGQRHALEFVLR